MITTPPPPSPSPSPSLPSPYKQPLLSPYHILIPLSHFLASLNLHLKFNFLLILTLGPYVIMWYIIKFKYYIHFT